MRPLNQPSFLSDDIADHVVGPQLTGKAEYLMQQQQKIVESMHRSVEDWRPPELPQLDAFDEVFIDLETDGLRWWMGDRMIGAGLYLADGSARYLPIRHEVGPNIPEPQFFEWCRRELRGKRIVNIRTKFDVHMFRADHIDLEAQGCTFGDVAHYAALLDDHRRNFNQEDLAMAYLGVSGKVHAAHGFELEAAKFKKYPAGLVAPRAEGDVQTVAALQAAMWPKLTEQDLHRVRAVEDGIIPVVVEMEQNGAPIDLELLERYLIDSEHQLEDAMWRIKKATGVDLPTPNNRGGIEQLFRVLGIPQPLDAETGKPSIADDLLAEIQHPAILDLRTAIALASLRSKFLIKIDRSSAKSTGILRYELHQLPYEDDEKGGGAVSGRFSSASMTYYDERGKQVQDGVNIQQIFGVKSQYDKKREFNPTKDFIVRKLFKADRRRNPGACFFAGDMRQIEYRRFVHFSGSERLIKSYQDNPLTDYHQLVHGLILEHTGKDFERTHVKNLNFASLYGAGLLKIAFMVGEINEKVYLELSAKQRQRGGYREVRKDPRIAKTLALHTTYHEMFPEVKDLLAHASHLAMTQCHVEEGFGACDLSDKWHRMYREYERCGHRGWVKTILGRRARFEENDRFYAALNRAIQGTAADDNKVAIIDVHNMRHELGFIPRFTVHDELGGDLIDPGNYERVAQFLNRQRLECRVPILWDTHHGESWADCK